MTSIFGAYKKGSGDIELDGKKINIKSPVDALKNGIVYLPNRGVPTDYIYTMGENLKHIHMSDYKRLAPGQGGLDFLPVMQALKDVGYDGYVTMEIGFDSRSVHPDSVARNALEHLKGLEKQLK